MDKKDTCEYCEGEIDLQSIRARFHFKGKTIYVDNVPAGVCSACGDHYFDAPVYKRLEEIAKHSEGIKKTIVLPIFRSYGTNNVSLCIFYQYFVPNGTST